METSYVTYGLKQPTTKLEIGGTVFFMRNHRDSNYEIIRAAFRDGKLCMDFRPREEADLPDRIIAERHYINVEPGKDVGLRIKTVEECDNMVYVTIYVVTSVHNPNGFMQFALRKYELYAEPQYANYASLRSSEEELVGRGFKCVAACTNEPFYAANTFFAAE